MEGAFKNTLIGFLLVALFGMMLLTGVTTVGDTYGKDTSEIVGGSMSLDKFNQSISDVEASAEKLSGTFRQGSIWSTIAGVVVEGIFGLTKDMFDMVILSLGVLLGIAEDTLGIPAYVTSVIAGIVIFSLIFSVWRLLKIGD